MEIFYHGTYRLFDHFSQNFLGQGEGKSQFGHGIYITSAYATAALYAAKAGKRNGVQTHYVYTVEVPKLTADNHIFSCRPVTTEVISRVEASLGCQIPELAKSRGKFFRKYVGNLLTGQHKTIKQMTDRADDIAESAASKFLHDNGVIYLVWPQAQTKPDGITNRVILDQNAIRIVKIEQVDVDDKNRLIEGSQREVTL